jgi:proteasome accessory factor B
MTKSATLHRHLCLIRQLHPPYLYPNKEYLLNMIREHGFSADSKRTLEKDFTDIKYEYGLIIKYSRARNGYYIVLPTDEDVSDFQAFLHLLERKERLAFLSESVGKVSEISRYLQLERNEHFRGTEHLHLLWEALRSRRRVQFEYEPYASDREIRTRMLEPGLILEDRNRWYLVGLDVAAGGRRTFGLDRIRQLQMTDQPISHSQVTDYQTFRRHCIGVTCPPDAPVERVLLRFTVHEGQYVRALPMHSSQQILREDDQFIDIELHVILNYELEREILGYGEEVEVLAPRQLRDKIGSRLENTRKKYC